MKYLFGILVILVGGFLSSYLESIGVIEKSSTLYIFGFAIGSISTLITTTDW